MKVHQALHGYAEGHQQLAASMRFGSKDNRTLLAMSDLPGPGARLSEEGYLTGYPLPEAGVYALARTWPAPEMARPGCVWTHTLLVDFADLATIRSLAGLLRLFHRPSSTGWQSYGESLRFNAETDVSSYAEGAHDWVLRLLTGLYGKPMSSITALRPPDLDVERVLVDIWAQQWPRLRRNFRFCTHTGTDRSAGSHSFDLQILPADSVHRSRFAKSIDVESLPVPRSPWIQVAYADFQQPDASGLRSFMRALGTEVSGGRALFRELCQLHNLLAGASSNMDDVTEAIALLAQSQELGAARGAQALVASAALPWVASHDDVLARFVVDHLSVLPAEAVMVHAARVGRALWLTSPSRFADAWQKGLVGMSLGPLIQDLTPAEIAVGLVDAGNLAPAMALARHDLLGRPEFWNALPGSELVMLVAALPEDMRDIALQEIVRCGRRDLIEPAFEAFGAFRVLNALNHASDIDIPHWLALAVRDQTSVKQFLQEGEGISTGLLAKLARANGAKLHEVGAIIGPWLNAFRRASSSGSTSDACYLHAFIFSLGFDRVALDAAECIVATFEWLHREAANERLTVEAWTLLDGRMPKLLWRDWDRCGRLRLGVCESFVRNNWDFLRFFELATDEDLFRSLVQQMSWSTAGRRYLAQSIRSGNVTNDQLAYSRVQAVKRVLFLKD